VIYYYCPTAEEIAAQISGPEVYLLSIYAKNDQSDMTAADRKAAKKFVEALKDAKKQASKQARAGGAQPRREGRRRRIEGSRGTCPA
jgi:plasmid stabilization system protein ParE